MVEQPKTVDHVERTQLRVEHLDVRDMCVDARMTAPQLGDVLGTAIDGDDRAPTARVERNEVADSAAHVEHTAFLDRETRLFKPLEPSRVGLLGRGYDDPNVRD